jgi:hypothetical protein
MSHPSSLIYLPPGVVPPAAAAPPVMAGIPFNRQFFESVLPQSVGAFCSQVECDSPRVELYTGDGTTHFVNAVSGVTDLWVALQTAREEHRHPIEVFLPYQTIYRVEIHPESDEKRQHLGFKVPADAPPPPAVQAAAATPAVRAKAGVARGAKAKK